MTFLSNMETTVSFSGQGQWEVSHVLLTEKCQVPATVQKSRRLMIRSWHYWPWDTGPSLQPSTQLREGADSSSKWDQHEEWCFTEWNRSLGTGWCQPIPELKLLQNLQSSKIKRQMHVSLQAMNFLITLKLQTGCKHNHRQLLKYQTGTMAKFPTN